jgi:hypothetical protein
LIEESQRFFICFAQKNFDAVGGVNAAKSFGAASIYHCSFARQGNRYRVININLREFTTEG